MKVTINVDVDIQDVYDELRPVDQGQFLKNNVGDLDDVSTLFDDSEIGDFAARNIEKIADENLVEELENRGYEVYSIK